MKASSFRMVLLIPEVAEGYADGSGGVHRVSDDVRAVRGDVDNRGNELTVVHELDERRLFLRLVANDHEADRFAAGRPDSRGGRRVVGKRYVDAFSVSAA